MIKEDQAFWQKLSDLIEHFEALDRDLLGASGDALVNTVDRILDAKNEIKEFLAPYPSITASGELQKKLRRIRENYGYNIDKIFSKLEGLTGQTISQEAWKEIDILDAWIKDGGVSYVDEDFFRRRKEAGPIICSQTTPVNFAHHLNSLKECYALGLFKPAIVFCRAVIEAALYEIAIRKGLTRRGKNDNAEYSLKELISRVAPICRYDRDKAKNVIELANRILHHKRGNIIIRENDALTAIKTTFALVEELFN